MLISWRAHTRPPNGPSSVVRSRRRIRSRSRTNQSLLSQPPSSSGRNSPNRRRGLLIRCPNRLRSGRGAALECHRPILRHPVPCSSRSSGRRQNHALVVVAGCSSNRRRDRVHRCRRDDRRRFRGRARSPPGIRCVRVGCRSRQQRQFTPATPAATIAVVAGYGVGRRVTVAARPIWSPFDELERSWSTATAPPPTATIAITAATVFPPKAAPPRDPPEQAPRRPPLRIRCSRQRNHRRGERQVVPEVATAIAVVGRGGDGLATTADHLGRRNRRSHLCRYLIVGHAPSSRMRSASR